MCCDYLLVCFDNMTVISLDVLETVTIGGAGAIASIIIAHVRLLLVRGIVTVVGGELAVSGVGERPPVLSTHALDRFHSALIHLLLESINYK